MFLSVAQTGNLWQMLIKDLKEFHNITALGSDRRKMKSFTCCTSLSYHSSINKVYVFLNGSFKIRVADGDTFSLYQCILKGLEFLSLLVTYFIRIMSRNTIKNSLEQMYYLH